MSTVVQLTGCVEVDEGAVIPFVSHEDADFYGVYIGQPGKFSWQADFLHYEDALIYVKAISKHHDIPIDDKTFYEGASNGTRH